MASNYALQTRSASEDPLFGQYLEQLPSHKLPTMTEIYRNFLYRRESEIQRLFVREGRLVKTLAEKSKIKIYNDLAANLKDVWWNGASIPVKDDNNLYLAVKNLVKTGSEFVKDSKSFKKIGKEEYLKRKGYDKILDISKCRYILGFISN